MRVTAIGKIIYALPLSLSGSLLAGDCPSQIGDPQVLRVAGLRGLPQQKALRRLMARCVKRDEERFPQAVFYCGDRLRPALRSLVQDPEFGGLAVTLLAFIAVREDLRGIIQSPPQPKQPEFSDRWAYSVACSLLDPSSDEDWSFLRKCALNEFDDAWVDAGAIQTLKLISSPRSRGILEEAQRRNSSRLRSVSQAIEYIESKPAPLVGPNLEALAARVARALSIGEWKGNGKPQCNETADKALVNFTFESGRDRLIYTATFHKSEAIWRLRGVSETAQMLMPAPVPTVLPQ